MSTTITRATSQTSSTTWWPQQYCHYRSYLKSYQTHIRCGANRKLAGKDVDDDVEIMSKFDLSILGEVQTNSDAPGKAISSK